MKDGKRRKKATKQVWRREQFNGSSEKDLGGGRVPRNLARDGQVLPQGRKEVSVTSQGQLAQLVKAGAVRPSKGPSKESGRAQT